eukprot:1546257-Pleurochrysis_carterae.AAC.2
MRVTRCWPRTSRTHSTYWCESGVAKEEGGSKDSRKATRQEKHVHVEGDHGLFYNVFLDRKDSDRACLLLLWLMSSPE